MLTLFALALSPRLVRLLALFAVAVPAYAGAVALDVSVANEFGPLTDVGVTRSSIAIYTFFAGGLYGGHFDCHASATLQRDGTTFTLSAQLQAGEPVLTNEPNPVCQYAMSIDLGTLAPETYVVQWVVALPDGTSRQTPAKTLIVDARGVRCNEDPYRNQVRILLPNNDYAAFANRLDTDLAYRASLGGVAFAGVDVYGRLAFPELLDPVRVMDRLKKSGEFSFVGPTGDVTCVDPRPPTVVAVAVEYYNATADRYFYTADEAEQAAIDAGKEGPWTRTGLSFRVIASPGCIDVSTFSHPVYRFTGIPDEGPNSHFFTVSEQECAVVRDRTDWAWMFEGVPFWAGQPVNGQCPNGTPLYRAYNNGKGGAPNHRYSTDPSVIAEMVTQGWVDEGIAMCVAR